MTSRILNRFNIKTGRLLRSLATDKLSCDIHPRKMIKMVRRVSRDHIIIYVLWLVLNGNSCREGLLLSSYEHLCDWISYILTYYLHFYNTTYYVFLTYHRVNVKV